MDDVEVVVVEGEMGEVVVEEVEEEEEVVGEGGWEWE